MRLELLVGKRIKEIREKNHISQEGFAEMVGTSPNYIYQIEVGRKLPSLEMLIDICKALNVTLDSIVNENNMSYEEQITMLLQNCSEDEIEIIIKTSQALKQALKDSENR